MRIDDIEQIEHRSATSETREIRECRQQEAVNKADPESAYTIRTPESAACRRMIQKKGVTMEFYPMAELPLPPFNLNLSGAALWEFIEAGKLIPFRRVSPRFHYGPPDPISGCDGYEPLFPAHKQKRYERLTECRSLICHRRHLLDQSNDEAWVIFVKAETAYGKDPGSREEFLRKRQEVLSDAQQQFEKLLPEAEDLDAEFTTKDLYANLQLTPSQQADFLACLREAYFRRDQIEPLLIADQKAQPSFEDTVEEVGREAEALYKEIKKHLHYERLDITTASGADIYHALIEVMPELELKHLGSIEIPMDLCSLKTGSPRQNFIEKIIQLFAKSKGKSMSLQVAGELYYRRK